METVLAIDSGIVNSMEVYIGATDDVEQDNWNAYSIKSILNDLGVPSKIWFTVGYPNDPDADYVSYAYYLIFDQPQAAVFYVMGQIADNSTYHICPLSLRRVLYIYGCFWGKKLTTDFSGWVELTEASDMSHEEFYNLFVNGNEETCIDLDARAFSGK